VQPVAEDVVPELHDHPVRGAVQCERVALDVGVDGATVLTATRATAGKQPVATRVFVTMTLAFTVTFDYRCPFAHNVHEHMLAGLAVGADWDVTFAPFSLGQVYVVEGEPDVWDQPVRDTSILALQAGVVVRDRFPEGFSQVHRALFAARHDEGRHLEDPQVVRDVLDAAGVNADAVFAAIADGSALAQVRAEHERMAAEANVGGVPTSSRKDRRCSSG
jgi:2-hydroxychromene-2-carboxylate isomerase